MNRLTIIAVQRYVNKCYAGGDTRGPIKLLLDLGLDEDQAREMLRESFNVGDAATRYGTYALTAPEVDALVGAALGESSRETGDRLHKSEETIKHQRKSVIAKLGARNTTHAVAIAYERLLIDPSRQRAIEGVAA